MKLICDTVIKLDAVSISKKCAAWSLIIFSETQETELSFAFDSFSDIDSSSGVSFRLIGRTTLKFEQIDKYIVTIIHIWTVEY